MKIHRFIFYFLFLLVPFSASAQYENLLHKPYAKKLNGYSKLYVMLITLKDSAVISHKTEEIKAFARKNNDKELELEMDLFMAYHNIEFKKHRSAKCISDLKTLINKAGKENIRHVKIRAIRVLADYYWTYLKNYELAFEQYLLQEKEIDKISIEDYPEKPRDLMKIGEAYYFFQDFARAEQYFKKAISFPENNFNTMDLNSARNTLGLCYQKEKKYDLSDYYFNQIIKTKFAKPQKEWVRIAKGNIGANYYYRKEYDKAVPLLKFDFDEAEKISDYGSAAGSAILLADIFLYKNSRQISKDYIGKARENITKSGQPERLQYWYPVVSKWFGASGKEKAARLYLDSTVIAINAYQEKFSALKMLQAQQKINLREDELRKTAFALENQRKINERNGVIILAVFLLGVIIFGYLIQKRRRQNIESEKLKVENELTQARNEINRFVQKINEQSNLVDNINNELQKIKSSESHEQMILEKAMTELRSATILTNEDWLGFKQNFSIVHSEFVYALKNKYPSVTDSEMRYLMLTKLQLSHKEMAQVLGISPDAVRVTWNRVRKKLNGTLEDTPQSLIENRI